MAEGAHDSQLSPIRAEHVKDVLTDRLGLDTRVTTLGHIQRGGKPCALDRVLVCIKRSIYYNPSSRCSHWQPTLQAVKAVDTLLEATPETPSYMIGMQENKVISVPLVEAVAMVSASPSQIRESR